MKISSNGVLQAKKKQLNHVDSVEVEWINVRRLCEVAEIEAQMFGLAQKFNRRTDVDVSTKPAILPNRCYRQVWVSLGMSNVK